MTKKEFVNLYFEKGGFETKVDAEKKAMAFLAAVEEALVNGDGVTFTGWGKFEVSERAARVCKNPRTGEAVNVEAKKVIKFKAGKMLEESVNR